MRRLPVLLTVATLLMAGSLAAGAPAAMAASSSCYDSQGNTTLAVGSSGAPAPLGFLGAATFGAQEGVWSTLSSATGTCATHDYVVVSVGGQNVLYIDPPCGAVVSRN